MKYFMHNQLDISEKLEKKIRRYFDNTKLIFSEIVLENKKYKVSVDIDSFLLPTNFDCFNCLTNCCVQFPYEFNSKARELILENIKEYNNLTQAVSILIEEGLTQQEIMDSIKTDPMLIPEKYVEKTFNRCTCSAVYIDRSLCALHKICIDRDLSTEEILDIKPLWCSIYPLEIIAENDDSQLYIFVPTEKNNFMSMNDSNFPCMNVKMSTSPYFRRDNPIGFKKEEYQPFITSYLSVLKHIFGDQFVTDILKNLNLLDSKITEIQYTKKI